SPRRVNLDGPRREPLVRRGHPAMDADAPLTSGRAATNVTSRAVLQLGRILGAYGWGRERRCAARRLSFTAERLTRAEPSSQDRNVTGRGRLETVTARSNRFSRREDPGEDPGY